MKEPKSKLPFEVINGSLKDSAGEWLTSGSEDNGDFYWYDEDVEYIAEACNNYPKAIELLRLYHKGASCKEKLYLSEVDEFLKEIGENV